MSSEHRVASSEHAEALPWFDSAERIATLQAVAAEWIGTRYCHSGAVKGNRASCHQLAGAVLAEAGFPIPPVPARGRINRTDYLETMREWLENHPSHFERVSAEQLAAGDLLLCKAGVGHIALFLGGEPAQALQVLWNSPTHAVPMGDPNVRPHIVSAYRPLEVTDHGL